MEAIKPGDWRCSNCNENNFAKRDTCRKCNTTKGNAHPSFGTGQHQVEGYGHNQIDVTVKKGDWICESCSDLNFANKKACRKCGNTRPFKNAIASNPDDVIKKPGDWECSVCKEHNFARNEKCRLCGGDKLSIIASNPDDVIKKPEKASTKQNHHQNNDTKMRSGDWCCSKCSTHNFAHRSACFKCNAAK